VKGRVWCGKPRSSAKYIEASFASVTFHKSKTSGYSVSAVLLGSCGRHISFPYSGSPHRPDQLFPPSLSASPVACASGKGRFFNEGWCWRVKRAAPRRAAPLLSSHLLFLSLFQTPMTSHCSPLQRLLLVDPRCVGSGACDVGVCSLSVAAGVVLFSYPASMPCHASIDFFFCSRPSPAAHQRTARPPPVPPIGAYAAVMTYLSTSLVSLLFHALSSLISGVPRSRKRHGKPQPGGSRSINR